MVISGKVLLFNDIKISFGLLLTAREMHALFRENHYLEVSTTANNRITVPGRGGGDSHMKQTGMLVVSLRGVNFGFWSLLGCSGQSANILSRQGLFWGSAKKHDAFKNYF